MEMIGLTLDESCKCSAPVDSLAAAMCRCSSRRAKLEGIGRSIDQKRSGFCFLFATFTQSGT